MVDLNEQKHVCWYSLSIHFEFQDKEYISFFFDHVTKTRDLNKDEYSHECYFVHLARIE
jgi:hypothetical protein